MEKKLFLEGTVVVFHNITPVFPLLIFGFRADEERCRQAQVALAALQLFCLRSTMYLGVCACLDSCRSIIMCCHGNQDVFIKSQGFHRHASARDVVIHRIAGI